MTELPGSRALCVRQQGVQSAAKFGALGKTDDAGLDWPALGSVGAADISRNEARPITLTETQWNRGAHGTLVQLIGRQLLAQSLEGRLASPRA